MMLRRVLPAVAAALALPAFALGADDPISPIPTWQEGLPTMLAALVVFGIVFAILATQVWPRIVKGLAEREARIRSQIEAAEAAQEQARVALEEYERNLAEARAEAQRMLDQTKQQQQQLAAELRAKADAEMNQMRERARRDIEAAKRAALSEIYKEVSQISTSVAAKILQREVTSDDQQRLVEESLEEFHNAVRA